MASTPKANGYKAGYALTEASRYSTSVMTLADRAIRELDHMREALGRPDYNRITALVAQLAVDSAKASKHLEEMRTLRAQAGQPPNEELAERVANLEARLAELQDALNIRLA